MDRFNFADLYRECGLNPSAEIIKLRKDAADEHDFGGEIEKIFDLTKIYFGIGSSDSYEWFINLFRNADPSFSAVDNSREMAVLAVCILAEEIRAGHFSACMAPLVLCMNQNRQPIIVPSFIEFAKNSLIDLSKREKFSPPQNTLIPLLNKSALDTSLKSYSETNDPAVLIKLFQTNLSDLNKVIGSINNENQKKSDSLVKEIQDLREEVEMLWWFIGGYSDAAQQTFESLDQYLLALFVGRELATLTKYETGPSAAEALLLKIVESGKKTKKAIGFESVIDSIPDKYEGIFNYKNEISKYAVFFPVNTALIKRWENGAGSWSGSFKKLTGLDKEPDISPVELAMQFYRENLLLIHTFGE